MSSVNKVSIMLVEDSDTDAEMTIRALNRCEVDCTLDRVHDGEQALAFLRQQGDYSASQRPDLVLLDLNMPKIDGRHVLRDIRAEKRLKSIPVVVLTTSEAETDVTICYALGANAYVVKRFDFDAYCSVLRKLCDFWFTVVKLPGKRRVS